MYCVAETPKKVRFAQGNTIATGCKFCSVCKNAGKSKEEYTSHFTKSEPGANGIVVCPTILSTLCTYCKAIGHFKSACPMLIEKAKVAKKNDIDNAKNYWNTTEQKEYNGTMKRIKKSAEPVANNWEKKTTVGFVNRFAKAFDYSSDDATDEESDNKELDTEFEKFPNLLIEENLAKIAVIVPINDNFKDEDNTENCSGKLNKPVKKVKVIHRNWASMTSSSDESDDDDCDYDSDF